MIASLCDNKAANPEGLTSELFKYAVSISLDHLAKDGVGVGINVVVTHITYFFLQPHHAYRCVSLQYVSQ